MVDVFLPWDTLYRVGPQEPFVFAQDVTSSALQTTAVQPHLRQISIPEGRFPWLLGNVMSALFLSSLLIEH